MEKTQMATVVEGSPAVALSTMEDVLLDCDGVLYDFCGHSLKAHGFANVSEYPRGVWEIPRALGITDAEFWRVLDTPAFWGSIPAFRGSAQFLGRVVRMCDVAGVRVAFCTSSSYNVGAFAEARRKALRNLCRDAGIARDVPVYITAGGGKRIFGGPGRVLVDDHIKNCAQFGQAGGAFILVPTPLNTTPVTAPSGCRVDFNGPDYEWLFNKLVDTLGLGGGLWN